MYDRGGEAAINESGSGGEGFHNPMDIFEMFFGGGGRQRDRRRGKNTVHQLAVTLSELYNGAVRKLNITRNIICTTCDGVGGKPGSVRPCSKCHGTGNEIHIRQIGPSFVQQIQSICSVCQGEREVIDSKDRCKTCNGKKVIRNKKIIEAHIDKGMPDGHSIKFYGEGDQEPGLEPGDIVIMVDEQKDDRFTRRRMDLICNMTLTLNEALCGFKRTITTLDDRTLVISSKPGEVFNQSEYRSIDGEGMPKYKCPFEKGRLIVKFDVQFPKSNFQSPANLAKLTKLLPPANHIEDIPEDSEEVALHFFDPEQPQAGGRSEAYDEDDAECGGQPRVQCASS